MSCRGLFVKTLCHGLFWLGFCHCIHDGMLPFCETLLYAILSHMLCTVWPTVVDAAVTRIARVLTKRARGQQALPPDQRQAVQTMPWQTAATSQEEGMDSVVALEPEAPQSTRPCAAW